MADVRVEAQLDARGFNAGITGMNRSVGMMASRMQSFAGGVQGVFAALAGGVLVRAARSLIDFGGALTDRAAELEMTVEELQAFEAAARQTGKGVDVMRNALARLADAQGEVLRDPRGMVSDAFARIGLSAEEVASLDMPSLMRRVATAYEQATDKASAFNAMGDIFGTRIAVKIRESLNIIARDFDGLSDSIAMTTAQAAELDRISDGLAEIDNAVKVLGGGLLVRIFDGWRFAIRAVRAEIEEMGGGVRGLLKLFATSGGNTAVMFWRSILSKSGREEARKMTQEIAERGKSGAASEEDKAISRDARLQTLREAYAKAEEDKSKRGTGTGFTPTRPDQFTAVGAFTGGDRSAAVSLAQRQLALSERMLEIEKTQQDILREISRNTGGGLDE